MQTRPAMAQGMSCNMPTYRHVRGLQGTSCVAAVLEHGELIVQHVCQHMCQAPTSTQTQTSSTDAAGSCAGAGYMTVSEDTAAFTAKAVLDPRTLNKRLHIRLPSNLLSQRDLIATWERLAGHPVKTSVMTAQEVDDSISGALR